MGGSAWLGTKLGGFEENGLGTTGMDNLLRVGKKWDLSSFELIVVAGFRWSDLHKTISEI